MNRWRTIRDGGKILYDAAFFSPSDADALFAEMRSTIPWEQGSLRGRPLPRLNAWFADSGLRYRYSGLSHFGSGWRSDLLSVKQQIEDVTGRPFNSVLLNLYRNGQDSIGFHADAEPELGTNPTIATLSFGATRAFVLKHKASSETLAYWLNHGCLFVMDGNSQHHWLHAIPKTKDAVGERISLTFRHIMAVDQPIHADQL